VIIQIIFKCESNYRVVTLFGTETATSQINQILSTKYLISVFDGIKVNI
jgi:hypothetical protein